MLVGNVTRRIIVENAGECPMSFQPVVRVGDDIADFLAGQSACQSRQVLLESLLVAAHLEDLSD